MDSFEQRCHKPIPIGNQRFAYQCESLVFEAIHGECTIRGYVPFKGGREPYPNSEKDTIAHYDLKLGRFTGNAIEVTLTKKFKDGSEHTYLTNVSFADLTNRIFEGQPANYWTQEAPTQRFETEVK